MYLHFVDGTYELFRAHYGAPPATSPDGRAVGAVRGLIQTLLSLLRGENVTHVACAFDHEIRSFRNEMFDGYKTGEDAPKELLAQFELAERAASALGLVTWPMVEFEADDVIATAVRRWSGEADVVQTVICSPDKDLMQLVDGRSVVCLDRRRNIVIDTDGVVEKMGVPPESIPDYLALVGDSADGIPGVPRWGAKSAATVLSRYGALETIPDSEALWDVRVRGARSLAVNLAAHRSEAALYKRLATLRYDVPIAETRKDLEWRGVKRDQFAELCDELGFRQLRNMPHLWSAS